MNKQNNDDKKKEGIVSCIWSKILSFFMLTVLPIWSKILSFFMLTVLPICSKGLFCFNILAFSCIVIISFINTFIPSYIFPSFIYSIFLTPSFLTNDVILNFIIMAAIVLCLEFIRKSCLEKLSEKKNILLTLITVFIFILILRWWYVSLWSVSNNLHKAEAFSALSSALAFFGLVATIAVQIETQKLKWEEIKRERIEATQKKRAERRENMLKRMKVSARKRKMFEKILTYKDERKNSQENKLLGSDASIDLNIYQ